MGRTIAKMLGVNECLTEAICLGHDLGHSPFGHSGESILDELMRQWGGFEHNNQTLRVVDMLEHPYPDFAGLNLMYETRLGFGKHKSRYDKGISGGFEQANCSLEGQIADIADRIAYNCHDIEDAMRAQIITDGQAGRLEIFSAAKQKIQADRISDSFIRSTRCCKTMVDMLVSDTIDNSQKNIERLGIRTVEDVYSREDNIICLSEQSESRLVQLEEFLMQNMYTAGPIAEANCKVSGYLGELFGKLCGEPTLMPGYYQKLIKDYGLQRSVCDYISGMTDRYCLQVFDEIQNS